MSFTAGGESIHELRELRRLMADRRAAASAFNLTVDDENDVAGCVLTVAEQRASAWLRELRGEGPLPSDAPRTWAGRLQQLLKGGAQ